MKRRIYACYKKGQKELLEKFLKHKEQYDLNVEVVDTGVFGRDKDKLISIIINCDAVFVICDKTITDECKTELEVAASLGKECVSVVFENTTTVSVMNDAPIQDNTYTDYKEIIKNINVGLCNKKEMQNDKDNRNSAHLIEQYKLLFEDMRKHSERRQVVSNYFLVANTALLGGIGYMVASGKSEMESIIMIASAFGWGICWIWHCLLQNYQKISEAKYGILNDIETLLPLSMTSIQWKRYGNYGSVSSYYGLIKTEARVPILLMWTYAIVYLYFAVCVFGFMWLCVGFLVIILVRVILHFMFILMRKTKLWKWVVSGFKWVFFIK